MSKDITNKNRLSDAFILLGSQYYSLARYTALNAFLPISATLFHHAIEYLLKGYLCQIQTLSELKDMSHNLVDLWNKFLSAEDERQLSRFGTPISLLNKVESLRYPDSFFEQGYVLDIRIVPPGITMHVNGEEKLPSYNVEVLDLDVIVLEILDACGKSPVPYFKNVPDELKVALPDEFLRTDDS